MARTVFCKKLQRELPGLDSPPWPGDLGQRIYDNISTDAWKMWEERMKMILIAFLDESEGVLERRTQSTRLTSLEEETDKVLALLVRQLKSRAGRLLPVRELGNVRDRVPASSRLAMTRSTASPMLAP